MEIEFDIIVVGAGPTGATVAKVLAANGLSVLVIERCKLPRYKSCSGMVIAKSVELVKRYFDIDIPDSVKCTPYDNHGMIFVNDEGKEYKFEQRGLNVWRSKFDNLLLSKAVNSGAHIMDGASVTACHNYDEYVEVEVSNEETIRARYLVDCEGATSLLKRRLLRCDKDFITTYQAFYDGKINLDPHYFYAYLQSEFSQYDAWFNVKDDMLVLGVAVQDNSKIKQYNERFIKYMQSSYGLQIKSKIKEEKWIMPHIRPDFHIDYGVGRVFFAGEVAGFLNPMGEGISCGIESGYAIAKAIVQNLNDSNEVLNQYIKNAQSVFDYMKRQWRLVSIMSKKFGKQFV